MSKARTLSNFISSGSPLADGTISVSEVSGAAPSDNPSFTGNITVSGTVDGRDIAADGTKLDGIESGATADQTASEILTAIKTVDGSASGLDADLLDGQHATAFATAAQGALADSAVQPGDNISTLTNNSGYITGNQTITLSGDVSGSGTTSIVVTVADDSHNHVISNVDGLQAALDGKLNSSSYTAADVLTKVKTVDGAGSGLDADLLDGLNSTSFIRSDANDTGTGGYSTSGTYWEVGNGTGSVAINTNDGKGNANLTFNHNGGVPDITGNAFRIEANVDSTTGATMYFEGISGATGGVSTNLNDWMTLSDSGATVLGQTVWTAGNDGSGSGLDADTLDGQHASAFLTTSGKAADSDLLDGLNSGSFLRSDAADVKTSGTLRFNDNVILALGTSDDAEFFCNGTHFYLDLNGGIGNFYIRDGTATRFTFDDAGHFTATGNVTAYSDERLKSNIQTIENAVDTVKALRGVTYDKDGKAGLGVIAQEVQKVLPEVVQEGEEYLSVAYGNIVGVLIEAIKEQQKQIDELKAKLEG